MQSVFPLFSRKSISHSAAILLLSIFCGAPVLLSSQGIITTVAGGPVYLPPDNSRAIFAGLGEITGVALDKYGNIYASDWDNNIVVRIAPAEWPMSLLSVVAGNGRPGSSGDGGPARQASINHPVSIAVDAAGNLYILEQGYDVGSEYSLSSANRVIRRVDPEGTITTLAYHRSGQDSLLNITALGVDPAGRLHFSAGNQIWRVDGDGSAAPIEQAASLRCFAFDPAGNLYFGTQEFASRDFYYTIMRRGFDGSLTRIAGADPKTAQDVEGIPATQALLYEPTALAGAPDGTLYVMEVDYPFSGPPGVLGARLRKIDPQGRILTAMGVTANWGRPSAMVVASPAGNVIVADRLNFKVRRVLDSKLPGVLPEAGSGQPGPTDDGTAATLSPLYGPGKVAMDRAGRLYVAEERAHRVRRIDPDNRIYRFAGRGARGFGGDGGPAINALLDTPTCLWLDPADHLYICDSRNGRVRRVSPDGIITTVAGGGDLDPLLVLSGRPVPAVRVRFSALDAVASNERGLLISAGNYLFQADGNGNLTAAVQGGPHAIGADPYGNLYGTQGAIHNRSKNVFRIPADLRFQTVAVWQSPQSYASDAVAVDAAGNIFVAGGYAEYGPRTLVYRFNGAPLNGQFTSLVDNGGVMVAGGGTDLSENGPAASASMTADGLYVDPAGNLLISDALNNRIRRVTPCAFVVTPSARTLAASAGTGGFEVIAASACTWLASSNASWLQITAPITERPGSGSGAAFFTATANPDPTPRTALVNAGGAWFTLTQEAAASQPATAFEPALTRRLPPGYYIAEVTQAPGASGGYWGLEVIASRGQASGGFNVGGGLSGSAANPGFAAFALDSQQKVTATATAPLAPRTSLSLRFLDAKHNVVAGPVSGISPLALSSTLEPGFYIAEATGGSIYDRTTGPVNFSLALAADYFVGGLNTGGYLGPGIVGFGAFYLPEEQEVAIRAYGRNTYGAAGAGSLVLTLKDAQRNMLEVVSPP